MDPKRLQPNQIEVARLAQLWHAGRSARADSQRSDETLTWLLTSGHTQWYEGPKGSLWYLTGFDPDQQSAVVNVLNDKALLWKNFETSFLAKLMDSAKVRKLYALIPKPAKLSKRAARMASFKHEGALREATQFDGRRVSLEVFGLLRREVKANAHQAKNQETKSTAEGPKRGA